MPRLAKRSRRRDDSDDEDEDEDEEPTTTQRRQTQTTQRPTQRRRSTPPEEEEESYENGDGVGRGNTQGDKIEKRARKLVRYALACSFSRTSVRRTDVVKKVMDNEVSRGQSQKHERGKLISLDLGTRF